MGDVFLRKQGTEQLTFLHAGGAHQNGATLLVHLSGFFGHRSPFRCFGFVHLIHPVLAGAHPVRRHDGGLQGVGLFEFHFLCFGRTGHPGQTGIEQKEILIGNRRQGLRFWLNRQALFGLNRLVLSITPTPAWHHPARELIHDHRLTIANDVVHITHKQLFGLEGVGDVVRPRILWVVEIFHTN